MPLTRHTARWRILEHAMDFSVAAGAIRPTGPSPFPLPRFAIAVTPLAALSAVAAAHAITYDARAEMARHTGDEDGRAALAEQIEAADLLLDLLRTDLQDTLLAPFSEQREVDMIRRMVGLLDANSIRGVPA